MKQRILSGMRPSGKLHLGHLFGALDNWAKLQDSYECFYMVADWHAITTEYENTKEIEDSIYDMVIDWLAVGLDPSKSVILRQSWVKEHAELHLAFSMIVPLSWLYRCPTYKEQLKEVKNRDLHTYGFLGYPVLQAADILVYRANAVPVGEDQLPHLELTREIARRFNYFYGEVFPEPQALLTPASKVPGIDGRKMSKSYGNSILLSDTADQVRAKVQQMFTDPTKIKIDDPGHPEGCVVYAFHSIFGSDKKERAEKCCQGKLGCVTCKKELMSILVPALEPIRKKRDEFAKDKKLIEQVLVRGSDIARGEAVKTMELVKKNIWNTK